MPKNSDISVTENRPKKRLKFSEFNRGHDPKDVLALAKDFHGESRFSYIEFAPKKVKAIVERVLNNNKREAILMCWEAERPLGALYCSVGEYHIGYGSLITTCHSIFVRSDIRGSLLSGRVTLGLMKGMESWSKARSSQEILFHATADIDAARVHKFIKRLGYQFIGGSYARSLV